MTLSVSRHETQESLGRLTVLEAKDLCKGPVSGAVTYKGVRLTQESQNGQIHRSEVMAAAALAIDYGGESIAEYRVVGNINVQPPIENGSPNVIQQAAVQGLMDVINEGNQLLKMSGSGQFQRPSKI